MPALARWLLADGADATPDALADDLVLLPSSRAADALRHALLSTSAAEALLLPTITTPVRLADWLADQFSTTEVAADLDPALRPLLLAPHLAATDWLRERPEAADGLAAELVRLFDEVRWAQCADLVLAGTADDRLDALVDETAVDVLQSDLRHLREAWRLYREVLPLDVVDRRLAALDRAGQAWPGAPPRRVVVAHLGRIEPAVAALLRRLYGVHWLTFRSDDPRSRLLLATYADETSRGHPLGASRRLAAQLGTEAPAAPAFVDADLPGRLHVLGPTTAMIGPTGVVRLLATHDPEHEGRVAAACVNQVLERDGETPRVIVATPDRDLAARITAQLRDAGVDVDDTRGRAVALLPAGRLLLDLVRLVVAGWPFARLFEVLTHPYVALGDATERRVVMLEMEIRRVGRGAGGRAALHGIAAEADRRREDAAPTGKPQWRLVDLVDRLIAALAPLEGPASQRQPWSAWLAALRTTWHDVAPHRPLVAGSDPRLEIDDSGAVAGVLAALDVAAASGYLGMATLADVAAALESLLGDQFEARPHRQRHLPVQVMGLVEARLADADLVVLAGLGQDTFPGNVRRPLFLGDGVRRGLGLETWRERIERDAELFLRLLHAAPRVILTWPTERDGRPGLPSPLVMRLQLAGGPDATEHADEVALWRRHEPQWDALAQAELAFRREPEPVPAPGVASPPRLSHTALRRHRDCPYAYLMAHALRLRRTDPVTGEYTALDHGTLAHAAMQRFLVAGGPGARAVVAGDAVRALQALTAAADEVFHGDRGENLAQRDVAWQSFLALAPAIVAGEIARAALWRPRVLEAQFRLTLAQVRAWLGREGDTVEAFPDALAEFPLEGRIDRIDTAADGSAQVAVVDYKTGASPAKKDVASGREPQLALYALAVEMDAVAALPRREDAGWRVAQGDYYGLRHAGVGWEHVPHLAPGDPGRSAMREAALAILREAGAILDPAVPYALVPEARDPDARGDLPCTICEFAGICRVEERDLGPIVQSRLTAMLGGVWRRGS